MGDRKSELSEGCGCLVMLAALAVLIIAYALMTGAAEAMGEGRVFESPVFESPVFESPVFESPVFESPVFESPVFESPVFESPVFESPVFESPLGEGVIRAQVLGYEYMLPVVVVGGGES